MANDLSELQTHIISDLSRADVSLSDIILLDINSAVREYEATRFFFNERELGPVTLSNTTTYALTLWAPGGLASLPSDIIEIDSVRVNLTGRAYTLDQVSYIQMNDIDEASTSTPGYPQIYAVYNRNLRIYPNAASSIAISGTISAHVKFPDLATGTDSNVWTNEAKELIRCATLKRLYGRKFKDPEAAAAAAQMEGDALQSLLRRTAGLGGTRIRSVL